MATDRSVSWSVYARRTPSLRALRLVCEDYTRGLGATVRFDGDRFFVTLPGHCAHPLRRVARTAPYEEPEWLRWIEVWKGVVDGRVIVDVMTRSADEITSAVAEGLAALVARHWGGTREC